MEAGIDSQQVSSSGILRWVEDFAAWGRLVAFTHTIFAFPFAISMLLIISRTRPVALSEFLWIALALVSARTAAMTFNRVVDRRIDARNPRTSSRELPAGRISLQSALVLLFCSSAAFFTAAYFLGLHCLLLAPAVLAFLFFYSWSKRVTRYSHLVLGAALAMAPGGVWFALTAQFNWEPMLMMAAVALWVAGFDVIYSCQDVEFDRKERLFSIPAKLGVERALVVARLFHIAAWSLLLSFGAVMQCSWGYYLGLIIFGVFLLTQHQLVSARNLSRVNQAFFVHNGLASLIYMFGVLVDSMRY